MSWNSISPKMKETDEVTQRILNITLEILYLLTGEDYIIVKKPGGRTPTSNRLQVVEGFCRKQNIISMHASHSMTSERSEEKILELTKKMTELLTGEVPVRCQDVTVYFSMEEWEYLEEHKDLYKDIIMDHHKEVLMEDCQKEVVMEECQNEVIMEVCHVEVISDNQKTLLAPDCSEGRRTTGGILVTSQCEEDMITNANPEGTCEEGRKTISMEINNERQRSNALEIYDGHSSLDALDTYNEQPRSDTYDGHVEPEGLDLYKACIVSQVRETYERHTRSEGKDTYKAEVTTTSVEGVQIRIKEEPMSSEEESLAGDNFAEQSPFSCVHIKEEPQMFEVQVPSNDSYVDQFPHPLSHIKVETAPAKEDSCSTLNIYAPRDQVCSTPVHIKEEPGTFVLQTFRHEEHTHEQHSLNAIPKTLAYEVEIPKDKAPVKGPENASLYSVRQKEDSMEILYHCPSCYKGFSSNLDLARHQVIHTVNKLFICSLCGKSFTEMSFLVKHQVIHTDLKLCVCPVCGGCFYSETSLAKHQKSHSLPSFCSSCGKCFFNKTELAIHERKHSGEKPFGCHICGKHFIAKSVLNKHMIIHATVDVRK